jgi:hypothetical protein
MEEKKVISIEEIREKAQGTVIEISDWSPNGKIAVRVRAIDMTPHILALEKMPNALKNAANEVFNGKTSSMKQINDAASKVDMDDITGMMPIIEGIVREVLVEPKYDEIQAIYPLTLNQKMELFKFAMGGIEKLDSFRTGL